MTLSDFIFSLLFLSIAALLIDKFIRNRKQSKTPIDNKAMSFLPGDGHKIWELNKTTLEMCEADYVEKSDGTKAVAYNNECVYCTALNEKNAIKQFSNMVPGKFVKL